MTWWGSRCSRCRGRDGGWPRRRVTLCPAHQARVTGVTSPSRNSPPRRLFSSMSKPAPVYLDHAATTPVRPEVLEAMLPYLGAEAFGNPSSAHKFGRTARAGLEQARREVAEAVGAEPNQVIFTSGGTEADNLGIVGA